MLNEGLTGVKNQKSKFKKKEWGCHEQGRAVDNPALRAPLPVRTEFIRAGLKKWTGSK
jgi:hypothetical protein